MVTVTLSRGTAAMKSLFPVALSLLFPLILPFSEILPKACSLFHRTTGNRQHPPVKQNRFGRPRPGGGNGNYQKSNSIGTKNRKTCSRHSSKKIGRRRNRPAIRSGPATASSSHGPLSPSGRGRTGKPPSRRRRMGGLRRSTLHIQPHGSLEEIDFQTDKPLKFGRAGAVSGL